MGRGTRGCCPHISHGWTLNPGTPKSLGMGWGSSTQAGAAWRKPSSSPSTECGFRGWAAAAGAAQSRGTAELSSAVVRERSSLLSAEEGGQVLPHPRGTQTIPGRIWATVGSTEMVWGASMSGCQCSPCGWSPSQRHNQGAAAAWMSPGSNTASFPGPGCWHPDLCSLEKLPRTPQLAEALLLRRQRSRDSG